MHNSLLPRDPVQHSYIIGSGNGLLPLTRYLDQCQLNTLRPRQHGRHFADDTFKRIFLNENVIISIKISLTFVPKGPINNIPALVQIIAWRRLGYKPLSEAMMVSLLTHICVTRPQWVNSDTASYIWIKYQYTTVYIQTKCSWIFKGFFAVLVRP